MEEARSSPPTSSTTAAANTERKQEMSAMSRMKKECLSFAVSLQEGFCYLKATIVGQGMKLVARNEKEASEADLQTAKMQVEAADAAEDSKKRLDKSN
ncbi:hypothetical protein F0562_035738 [Nyssa sinensis]|uniref:Uncharacterized protein n=1 Tax=Nyssa sinensis TaxID=561372 RepID=A0A5J5ABT5_9ASTE|nr:hypothetical protein F0562_035738 [Nyssa sinensis]